MIQKMKIVGYLIAYPISKNTEWKQTIKQLFKLKLGYDRFYNTNLPFK